MENSPSEPPLSRSQRLRKFLMSVRFKLYCSYFLSTWGTRMWSFALSVALGVIGGNLQYTAISGFVNAVVILLLGSSVGMWVDKTQRLKAASLSLIVNNFTVAGSVAILAVIIFFPQDISPVWNGSLSTLMVWISILLCACSGLASVATNICITKDWVVVICGRDKEKLAHINSTMVVIDMTALVLSPLLAGQLMSSFGTGWGCAFIGFWNLGSFVIEYFMLRAVYYACPDLAVKGETAMGGSPDPSAAHAFEDSRSATAVVSCDLAQEAPEVQSCCTRGLQSIKAGLKSIYDGHRTYFAQPVLPAGVALASLYLTVLGFDGTTIVYILSLGLPSNLIALCQGLGALMGIAGSLVYPRMRRRLGVDRTGLISLSMEWMCLLLPVASIWLPGSNFDPRTVFSGGGTSNGTSATQNQSSWETDTGSVNGTVSQGSQATSQWSLSIFLLGIILSRMGLWIADLSISQIFQERIGEQERGVVNGVQNSLNNVMDMLKNTMVICLPDPRTFGIPIIVSWLAIFGGYCCYCYYSWKQRGHLLPFHRQFDMCVGKNGAVQVADVGRSLEETGGDDAS